MAKKPKFGGIKGPDGHVRFPRTVATDSKRKAREVKTSLDALGLSMHNKTQSKSFRKKTERQAAFDYFSNALARTGYGTPSLPEATSYELERLSNNYWLMVTLYRNHWIARRVVDLPAQDMTRAWPKLTCDISPDDISKFDNKVMRSYTPQQMRRAMKWSRLYGGAGALIAIKGHEDMLDEPLDLDDVTPGSYLGLIPFDRWVGINPTGPVADNYERPTDWGLPEYYECNAPDTAEQFKVHSSRIIRFSGPEVPTPELQAQMYWGISCLEVIWEELKKRDNASFAILNLLMRANIIARIEPSLEQMLSGLGTTQTALKQYQARMQAQNELLSNQSMMVLGKDADMKSVQYSFAGMGEVYAQFQMDIAGASEIPVTRLFGRTITGLGQSNDADERYYEEKIAQEQNSEMRPQLDKLYPVICMSELGEVPEDLDYTFPSIRVLTEEEKADLLEKASAPILAAYNSGVISQKTVLQEFQHISEITEIFTNVTDEEIDEAEDEVQIPGEGGMPGEGGEGEEGEPAKSGPEEKGAKKALPNPQRLLKQASAGAEDAQYNYKKNARSNTRELRILRRYKSMSPEQRKQSLAVIEKMAGKSSQPYKEAQAAIEEVESGWAEDSDDAEFIEAKDAAAKLQCALDAINKKLGKVKDSRPVPSPTQWQGMDVTIENPAGSIRKGKNPDYPWEIKMANDYGFLNGTEGVDGDECDVFLGPDPDAKFVYTVHTMKVPDFTEYDEDKHFLNFSSEADARKAFYANYDTPEHFGALEKFTVEGFIKKIRSVKAKPISEVVDSIDYVDGGEGVPPLIIKKIKRIPSLK